MIKNIPNKYNLDSLLEIVKKNHVNKYNFFYLPIDFNVSLFYVFNFTLSLFFRISAMLVMHLLTLLMQSLSRTFIWSLMAGNGRSTIVKKYFIINYKF